MIKVNTQTLAATRDPVPANIKGLQDITLTNLQTELNPVPEDLIDLEWWPADYTPAVIDVAVEYVSGETLAANADTKTVLVTDVLTNYTADELAVMAVAYEAAAVKAYGDAVQSHMDAECHLHVYEGILSLCTYVTSPSTKFSTEGQAGVVWRDACWAHTYGALAEVKAGVRTEPTVEELIAELPAMVWPV